MEPNRHFPNVATVVANATAQLFTVIIVIIYNLSVIAILLIHLRDVASLCPAWNMMMFFFFFLSKQLSEDIWLFVEALE